MKTAHDLAKKQKEISVAEFFEKNRHLLGFDNPNRSLLTTVKEAVDNSLDASQEIGVLPDIKVRIDQLGETRFKVSVEDNGPGIIKSQIAKIFGKLLYGSKFFSMQQSRGQQGIGISASVLYSQLTTGKPAIILSKIKSEKKAHYYELKINTKKNSPEVIKEGVVDWPDKKSGVKITLELEGKYQKGRQSVDEYLKQTAIVNPYANIEYINPKKERFVYARVTTQLPKKTIEIKPHPYGIELGVLQKMISLTSSRTLQGFLTSEFSRVGLNIAKAICSIAKLDSNKKPSSLDYTSVVNLLKAMKEVKISSPSSDSISPIGESILEKGLKKELNAEFYCSVTRPPSVYRGMPFQIEAAIAYGGDLQSDNTVNLYRFANRVPLLYQQGGCAITHAVVETDWKRYGLHQSKNSLPIGPAVILVHMASVWVPYTSESKEAIAHYPEILKEVKLALQECGRKLSKYISKKIKVKQELKKKEYLEKYLPHMASALSEIINIKKQEQEKIIVNLKNILERNA